MKLNNANYFSSSSANEYMSNSQFKDFMKCEAMAMAKIRGEYQEEETSALLVGGYIDAYFSDELEIYKAAHPNIFKKDGSLKSEYVQAEQIIKVIEDDPYMMGLLSGDSQVIETGEIEGVPFKIKMDSLLADTIVDQKVMKDVEGVWKDGMKQPFWKAYGYDIQLAIYQYIHAQNCGEMLPCKLAVVTKEKATNKKIYKFRQETLNNALAEVKALAPHFAEVKMGLVKPTCCGECPYCRAMKKLSVNDEEEI